MKALGEKAPFLGSDSSEDFAVGSSLFSVDNREVELSGGEVAW